MPRKISKEDNPSSQHDEDEKEVMSETDLEEKDTDDEDEDDEEDEDEENVDGGMGDRTFKDKKRVAERNPEEADGLSKKQRKEQNIARRNAKYHDLGAVFRCTGKCAAKKLAFASFSKKAQERLIKAEGTEEQRKEVCKACQIDVATTQDITTGSSKSYKFREWGKVGSGKGGRGKGEGGKGSGKGENGKGGRKVAAAATVCLLHLSGLTRQRRVRGDYIDVSTSSIHTWHRLKAGAKHQNPEKKHAETECEGGR
ncbi:hypothetical protein CYMTET_10055 [Cymbomonas tetramitiformis]|uniref:Uncharacterized protein n=1 Tax=Cymbomonas tetramitiformis TaxID=36881 RepID=A0AAE0LEI8_9CHLO|nr:hypothetical protein CYMTET_10055 [Cymbomonas tetramitiformis]